MKTELDSTFGIKDPRHGPEPQITPTQRIAALACLERHNALDLADMLFSPLISEPRR